MGETGLFQYLSEANMAMFEQAGINHIVTGDPHSFYSFSNEYPFGENGPKVQHYTQFLNEIIDEGKLKLISNVNQKGAVDMLKKYGFSTTEAVKRMDM